MSIKVLVVDDSAMVRRLLTEILDQDPEIEVVGAAPDPYIARDKIKRLNPDVITLDVEMPRMDGLTFLANLMRLRPMPVVMVSSLTAKGAEVTLKALELGAVDFVTKPAVDVAHSLEEYAETLIDKVKAAARVRVRARAEQARPTPPRLKSAGMFKSTDKVIAVGASTGGTEAIKALLEVLPPDTPGIVITQHIPAAFSGPFAQRMDKSAAMIVCEAEDGQQILPGHVYIAPGDRHLKVSRSGARYLCRLDDGPRVNRHKPSVDVLFHSVAENVGPNALGVILTGMGDDGARGMKAMHEAGAYTIAQDEATSVVWGMPGEAVAHGGVDEILPLGEIPGRLLARLQTG